MARLKSTFVMVLVVVMAFCLAATSWGGQVWTKCNITCRCLQNDSVGNFEFAIPVEVSPDIGFDADWACKTHGHRVCSDSCNGTKFAYTYQVTSP